MSGILSAGIYQLVAALSPILLVPLFIRAWSAAHYGHWVTLTAVVSGLTLVDFGGPNYIGNLLAQDYAVGNEEGFKRRLEEGVSLFTAIAILVLCIATTLLFTSPLPLLVHVGVFGWEDRGVLFFLGASVLLSIPLGVLMAVFRAVGLYAASTMLDNVLRLVTLGLYACLLFFGVTPALFAGSQLFGTTVLAAVVIAYAYRKIPQCRNLKLSLPNAAKGIGYLKGSLLFWLFSLALVAKQQGPILVLGAIATPLTVVLFATHRTFAGLIGYMVSLFSGPLWPEITGLAARCEWERLGRLFFQVLRLVVSLSGIAAIGLWFVFPFLYPLWTGRQLVVSPTLLLILIVQGMLASGWNFARLVLLATNRQQSIAIWSLGNALITVLLAIAIGSWLGTIGVAIAGLIGDLLCAMFIFPKLAGAVIGQTAKRFFVVMGSSVAGLLPLIGSLLFIRSLALRKDIECYSMIATALGLAYPTLILSAGKNNLRMASEKFRSIFDYRTRSVGEVAP